MASTTTIPSLFQGETGKVDLEKRKKLQEYMNSISEEAQQGMTDAAKKQVELIKANNLKTYADYKKYIEDVTRFKAEQEGRIEGQRTDAKENLKKQEAAVGLEAQIQGAKAGQTGKLSQGQLAKVSRDVADSFLTSLNKARTDLLTFEQGLDDKLSALDFDLADKEKMITGLKRILSDEEIKPLIDALASNAKTNQEFLKMLSAYTSSSIKETIDNASQRNLIDQRYREQRRIFEKSSEQEKKTYLTRWLGELQFTEGFDTTAFIEKALTAVNPDQVLAEIHRMSKLDKTKLQALQTIMTLETPAKEMWDKVKSTLDSEYGPIDTVASVERDRLEQALKDKAAKEAKEEEERLNNRTPEEVEEDDRKARELASDKRYTDSIDELYVPSNFKRDEVNRLLKELEDKHKGKEKGHEYYDDKQALYDYFIKTGLYVDKTKVYTY